MRRVLAIAPLAVVAVTGVLAQSSRGVITGLVTDPSGAAVPQAEVTLRSTLQGTTTIIRTNGDGIYRFDGVNPGDYTVTVRAENFNASEAPANVVVGATVGRDFKLAVGYSTTVV